MSDGNYNRNLLPYHNYRSGFNAGRIQMKHKAEDAFKFWYKERFPNAAVQEILQSFNAFCSYIEDE